jgi:hypothetical protein
LMNLNPMLNYWLKKRNLRSRNLLPIKKDIST